jgi:N-hydroxyarylamine O-acetyltransferase
MQANNFVLAEYLKRIGFSGDPKADHGTLRSLMLRQLFSVPFENLDVQAGKIVSLVPEDIVEKIVQRKRGGYCYEVNGLFAMALQAMGIPYQFVAARPMFYPMRRPKTHMAVVATVEGKKWLCDLGFGSYGIREPLSLGQLGVPVRQGHDEFKLTKINEREYLFEAKVDGEWKNQYSFDLYEPEWIDFAPANYLNSTHPEAVFVQKHLIIQHTEDGRKVLFGDTLKIISNGQTKTQPVTPDSLKALLLEHFALSK